MTINLDIDDLIALVVGKEPRYEAMVDLERRGLGNYAGGFLDRWTWNRYALQKLEEGDLYGLHLFLKRGS